MQRRWLLASGLAAGVGAAFGAESCAADTFTSGDADFDAGRDVSSDSPITDVVGPPTEGGSCACDGGTCVSGMCILPMGDTPCMALGVSGDGHVYWADARLNGTVYRMTTDGSAIVERLATNQPIPRAIVVDGTSVFWATSTTIISANLNGGSQKTVQSYAATARATALALDANNLYYGALGGGIFSVPRNSSGTSQQIVALTITPAALKVVGNVIYWTANGTVDGGSIAQFSSMNSLDGGGVALNYVITQGMLHGFVVATDLYVAHTNANQILWGGPTAPGGLNQPFPAPAPFDLARDVTLNGQMLYWSMFQASGGIAKSDLTNGTQTIASNESFPTCIGVDAKQVWWVSGSHVVPASAPK